MAKLLVCGLWAGLIAGLLWGLLIVTLVSPVVLEAETYESGSAQVEVPEEGHSDGHSHDEGEGWSRNVKTILGAIALGGAFGVLASLIVTMLSIAGVLPGDSVTSFLLSGFLFGMLGFLAVHGIPAIGLPPPPPGIEGAAEDFPGRQVWFLSTIFLSVVAFLGFFILPGVLQKKAGVSLPVSRIASGVFCLIVLALPFIFGVPEHSTQTLAPDWLQVKFLWTSLGVNAIYWLLMGVLLYYFMARISRGQKKTA